MKLLNKTNRPWYKQIARGILIALAIFFGSLFTILFFKATYETIIETKLFDFLKAILIMSSFCSLIWIVPSAYKWSNKGGA